MYIECIFYKHMFASFFLQTKNDAKVSESKGGEIHASGGAYARSNAQCSRGNQENTQRTG